jgi:8-oxo-dGTP diphosphatase/2-hydroxy-dATP diphosphatase
MVSIETLVIVHQDSRVLLAMKKRGFGAGKWNGFGGKLTDEDNGSLERAAYRETLEEAGIHVKGLEKIGETLYKFRGDEQDHLVHIYVAESFEGDPVESEEMRPKWFDVSNIPYDDMWKNDKTWLPYLLERKKFNAEIYMSADGETLSCDINEVEKFE